jgi:hypothetical protein
LNQSDDLYYFFHTIFHPEIIKLRYYILLLTFFHHNNIIILIVKQEFLSDKRNWQKKSAANCLLKKIQVTNQTKAYKKAGTEARQTVALIVLNLEKIVFVFTLDDKN